MAALPMTLKAEHNWYTAAQLYSQMLVVKKKV